MNQFQAKQFNPKEHVKIYRLSDYMHEEKVFLGRLGTVAVFAFIVLAFVVGAYIDGQTYNEAVQLGAR